MEAVFHIVDELLSKIKKQIYVGDIESLLTTLDKAGLFSEYVSEIPTKEKTKIIQSISEDSMEAGLFLSLSWAFSIKPPFCSNIFPGGKLFLMSGNSDKLIYISDDLSVFRIKQKKFSTVETLGLYPYVVKAEISETQPEGKWNMIHPHWSPEAVGTISMLNIFLSSVILGGVRKAFLLSQNYSSEREQGGKPIKDYFAVKEKLWKMDRFILIIQNSLNHLSEKLEPKLKKKWGEREEPNIKANLLSILKDTLLVLHFAVEESGFLISEAIQVFGGYGYMKDYKVEKIFRNTETLNHLIGVRNIQRVLRYIEKER